MEHNLTEEEVDHVNAIIDHYNDLHPTQQQTPLNHATNEDHASMMDWVKGVGSFLGLSISTVSLPFIAKFFAQKLRGH